MYVKGALIDKSIKWIEGLKSSHPRPTILMAYGKAAMLLELDIIGQDEYDRLYDHITECLDGKRRKRRNT